METNFPSSSTRITPLNERRGSLFLTKFEIAKVVGERATEISSGKLDAFSRGASHTGTPTLSFSEARGGGVVDGRQGANLLFAVGGEQPNGATTTKIVEIVERSTGDSLVHDPVLMAKYELVQRRISLIVQRRWPDGHVENVPLDELEVDQCWLDLSY